MKEAAPRDDFYQWQNLSVGLTSACNLRCKMCPVVKRETVSLTREQAFHIADFVRRRRFEQIVIGGGEPTLMPYFWEFIEKLGETDIEIRVLTNATMLKPEHVQRLASNPNLIVNVSIDGVREVHDAIRGEGTFAKSDQAIRALIEAGGRVAVNTVVQRSNFRTMLDVYEHFKDHALDWHGFAYAEAYYADLELVRAEEFDESIGILTQIYRRNEARKGHAILSKPMLKNLQLWYRYPEITTHPGVGCTVPRRLLAIDECGWVFPCWHYQGWKKDPSRNLNERSLDEIVDDPEVREEILRVVGPYGCGGCSTTCYFWDNDFRAKTMHPTGRLRVRRLAQHAKAYLVQYHPHVAHWISKAKRLVWR